MSNENTQLDDRAVCEEIFEIADRIFTTRVDDAEILEFVAAIRTTPQSVAGSAGQANIGGSASSQGIDLAKKNGLPGIAEFIENQKSIDADVSQMVDEQFFDLIAARPAPSLTTDAGAPFQARVQPWMMECFGAEISADRAERNHRFFEEATELVQACGMTASEAHQLVDYAFGRPVGEPHQEVGGVMVTLAALCLANSLDMHADGETELARISVPETVAKISAKQAAKPKHSPLPEAARVVSEDRSDALCDMHYSRGLQAGFSLGQMDDNEGLREGVESREGYLKVLRETPRAMQLGAPMSAAARDVLAERVRQAIEEGRTATHDDRNDLGQLASAAACYAITHRWTRIDVPPPHWPCDWARAWWKPTTPRRDLVKAGALILAEIERIDRSGGEVCR
ncbi:hypothetical protein [Paraburkholderia bannensis]|uniref:hypothetical protein n=1 Tax=Paraburkholderia bannensis TaxID=765414 RepID=UPI0007C5422B|nr:hypothetical protein [Paraburkholderia bannensis]